MDIIGGNIRRYTSIDIFFSIGNSPTRYYNSFLLVKPEIVYL